MAIIAMFRQSMACCGFQRSAGAALPAKEAKMVHRMLAAWLPGLFESEIPADFWQQLQIIDGLG